MITENDIAKKLGRDFKSPVRIGSLTDLGLNQDDFLATYKPFFAHLSDDLYLVRESQISFLKDTFPEAIDEIESLHKDYFHGLTTSEILNPWIENLNEKQQHDYHQLSKVTRQRNISSFRLQFDKDEVYIERIYEDAFEQNVNDFRTWTRQFDQADKAFVENDLFYGFLRSIAWMVKKIHPEIKALKITSHFMRTLAMEKIKGENSPEGIHEDGSDYIVSALVIHRHNVVGAESQVFELIDGEKHLIYHSVLAPGGFIFQADTGEEKTFGNDLHHYVTPIEVVDEQETGIRDIIGLDIEMIS